MGYIPVQKSIPLLKDEMLLGQELKFKNKLCNFKRVPFSVTSQGIALGINVLFRCEALCGTGQNDAGIDTIKLEEYTAVLGNRVSLDSIAGTYNGVLPPNVETTLTLNADGTYLLIQS